MTSKLYKVTWLLLCIGQLFVHLYSVDLWFIDPINNKKNSCSLPLDQYKQKDTQFKQSTYFKKSVITGNYLDLRNILANDKSLKKSGTDIKYFNIQGSQTNISCTFFSRKKDSLIVIGPGLPPPRDWRTVLVTDFFKKYDVLLFDHRGQGNDYKLQNSFFTPTGFISWITYKLFGLDIMESRFGMQEHQDIIDIVTFMKKEQKYKYVYGWFPCYSAFVAAAAQVQQPDLFYKFIFDSCWISFDQVLKTIAKYPALLFSGQSPNSLIPFLTDTEWFQNTCLSCFECVTGVYIHNFYPLDYYLQKISIPVLFFISNNDCYCTLNDFNLLWSSLKKVKYKVAVISESSHAHHYRDNPAFYRKICKKFLCFEHKFFVEWLSKQEKN